MSTHAPATRENPGDHSAQRTRTYRGREIAALLPIIRAELGPDAIVVRQREGLVGGVRGFFAQRFVEIEAMAGSERIDVYDDDMDGVFGGPALPPPAQPAPAARPSEARPEVAAAPPSFAARLAVAETSPGVEPAAEAQAAAGAPAAVRAVSVWPPTAGQRPVAAAVGQRPVAAPPAGASRRPAATSAHPTPKQRANPSAAGAARRPAVGASAAAPRAAAPARPAQPAQRRSAAAPRAAAPRPATPTPRPPAAAGPGISAPRPAQARIVDTPRRARSPRPSTPLQTAAAPRGVGGRRPSARTVPAAQQVVPLRRAPSPQAALPVAAGRMAVAAGAAGRRSASSQATYDLAAQRGAIAALASAAVVGEHFAMRRVAGSAVPGVELQRVSFASRAVARMSGPVTLHAVTVEDLPQRRIGAAPDQAYWARGTDAVVQSTASPSQRRRGPSRCEMVAIASELQEHGVSTGLAESLVTEAAAHHLAFASEGSLRLAVRAAVTARLPQHAPAPAEGAVVAVVGCGGSGKTHCVAGLAAAYSVVSSLSVSCVALGAGHGAAELSGLLERHDVTVQSAEGAARIARRVSQARDGGMVVVDTNAVSPSDQVGVVGLGYELAVLAPTDVLVVLPATLGDHSAHRLMASMRSVGPTGIIVSHSDETDQIGVAVDVACASGIPIAYLNEGTELRGSLRPAQSADIAARLLP